MARSLIFGLLVLLFWLKLALCVDCERDFMVEPAQLADSPLDCNIIGKDVTLRCSIQGTGYQISWYYSNSSTGVGDSSSASANKIQNDNGVFSINPGFSGSGSSRSVTSDLILRAFNPNTHSGFYWSEMTEVTFPTSFSFMPSQVLHITAPFTLDQLKQCGERSLELYGSSSRCAVGRGAVVVLVPVIGVEFTNISTTTTSPPTTPTSPPTTPTPSPITNDTTNTTENMMTDVTSTDKMDLTTTDLSSSSNSVVRTAVIWFSVGAVALVLIVIAIILCSVAIARC